MFKVTNFNILFENGDKINKKKIQKLDDVISNLENSTREINLLLILSDSFSSISKSSISPSETNFKLLNNFLAKLGISPSTLISLKKIFENTYMIYSEMNKLTNQNKIIQFLNNFHQTMLEKINKKITKMNEVNSKFKNHREELENSFLNNLEDFKRLFRDDDSNILDMKVIEKAFIDFKKINTFFSDNLKFLNYNFNIFKERNEKKIIENALEKVSDGLMMFGEMFKNIYDEMLLLVSGSGNSNNNTNNNSVKEFLSKIEKKVTLNEDFFDKLNNLGAIRVCKNI
jgi:hypothetical protein